MRTAGFLFFLSVVAAVIAGSLAAQQSGTVKVKSDEIGGVVSSANGAEAGVWVIAETTDLPTRYIKEVVTDDQGRYLIPSLPTATYTVWARGYGLVDSPKLQTRPGKQVDLKPSVAPDTESRRAILSSELLVRHAGYPEGERISGHGTSRERDFAEHQDAGPVAAPDQDRQLRIVPPVGQPIHAHHSRACSATSIRLRRPGCGACSRDKRARRWWAASNQLGPERATAEFGDWTSSHRAWRIAR